MLGHLPRQLWQYARLTPFVWLDAEAGVAACRYPREPRALQDLAARGITVVLNLHERPHPLHALGPYGLVEVHVPVRDFTAPTQAQLDQTVAVIDQALAARRRIAVHCGAGLGRTGTVLACYLVARGAAPDAAIAQVRAVRPGSIETTDQAVAVATFAARRRAAPDAAI
jgi:atypical dual specificity phosphatase